MRNFDFFEFTSVLVPGTVLLFGTSRFFPTTWNQAFGADFTVGKFGLFVILAYIAGQLVQVLGQLIERRLWWFKHGLPTNWILDRKDKRLLEPQQRELLVAKVQDQLKLKFPEDDTQESRLNWFKVTRQIYAAVRRGGLNERVDLFNAHNNMFRGMIVSFLLLLLAWFIIWCGWLGHPQPFFRPAFWMILIAIACSYRGFLGYGELYGRELFVQFLELKPDDKRKPGKAAGDEKD